MHAMSTSVGESSHSDGVRMCTLVLHELTSIPAISGGHQQPTVLFMVTVGATVAAHADSQLSIVTEVAADPDKKLKDDSRTLTCTGCGSQAS